jgi:hypothetical protein
MNRCDLGLILGQSAPVYVAEKSKLLTSATRDEVKYAVDPILRFGPSCRFSKRVDGRESEHPRGRTR